MLYIKRNENNEAEIFGYIRGNTLIPGKYIHITTFTLIPGKYMHITGFGDYKIKDVKIVDDPLPVKSKYDKDKKNEMEVEKNNKNKDQQKIKMMI